MRHVRRGRRRKNPDLLSTAEKIVKLAIEGGATRGFKCGASALRGRTQVRAQNSFNHELNHKRITDYPNKFDPVFFYREGGVPTWEGRCCRGDHSTWRSEQSDRQIIEVSGPSRTYELGHGHVSVVLTWKTAHCKKDKDLPPSADLTGRQIPGRDHRAEA